MVTPPSAREDAEGFELAATGGSASPAVELLALGTDVLGGLCVSFVSGGGVAAADLSVLVAVVLIETRPGLSERLSYLSALVAVVLTEECPVFSGRLSYLSKRCIFFST